MDCLPVSEDEAAAKPGGATQSEEREEGEVSDAAPTAPCDEALATARAIAKRLREKKVHLIHALVQHFGGDTAQEALKETLQVEAGGGMTTRDGSRRRDAGGVFLELFARRVNKTELNRLQRNAQKAWVRRGEKALPSKRLRAPDEEDEGQTGRRRRGAAADSGDVL